MKATRLLESQHRQVEAILRDLQTGVGDPDACVRVLADAIAAHSLIEEEIFYPAVRTVEPGVADLNVEEHDVTAIELQRLLATCASEPAFAVRVRVIQSLLQEHVRREENVIFPRMDRAIDPAAHEAMGLQMEARFNQVLPCGSQQILNMRETRIAVPEVGTVGQPGQPGPACPPAQGAPAGGEPGKSGSPGRRRQTGQGDPGAPRRGRGRGTG